MSQAMKRLDESIDAHLQQYLGIPIEDRTQERYDRLADSLARAAIDYAKAFVEERVAARRSMQGAIVVAKREGKRRG